MNGRIEWMMITADLEIAKYAQASGVHRIFVDMEVMGKAERQGHLDTHKASHTLEDISAVREVVTTSELMVRINPLHDGTATEVAQTIDHGADRLMLPMFTTRADVEAFRDLVPNTTPITFLAETPAALVRTREWASLLQDGDEVHYGLNDLSIAMGLDFLFEPMAADMFHSVATYLTNLSIPFGIGGIARPTGGELPAKVVLGEHVRLQSSRLILSRAFHGAATSLAHLTSRLDLADELKQLRTLESSWRASDPTDLEENHALFVERCFTLAGKRRSHA